MAGIRRHNGGGIGGLAAFIIEHAGAVEYDLLTRTHLTLNDVPHVLDWWQLGCFVKYLPADSATKCECVPRADAAWEGSRRSPMLLADLYDMIQILDYHVLKGFGAKPRKPKPYPRPGVRGSTSSYGSEAIKIADFDEWWNG